MNLPISKLNFFNLKLSKLNFFNSKQPVIISNGRKVLSKLRPSDPYMRSEEVLRTKTPSQAAGEGDLVTLETYRLRGEDFNKVDDEGNNQKVMKNNGRAILRVFQNTFQKIYFIFST